MDFDEKDSIEYIARVRSNLHQIAEPSGEEYQTGEYIANALKDFGYKVNRAHTGSFCDIGKGSGLKIAFRADFDALPIKENTGRKDSCTNGYMHACGHDGHTANLLNVARLLAGNPPPVPVRLIFQFGEEGIGGGETMIECGALKNVREIYALHINPLLPACQIGYTYGAMFAGCTEFDVDISGLSSHCAKPELAKNALFSALEGAVNALEYAKKHPNTILNLGKIQSGTARNVIADSAHLEYTLRYFDFAARDDIIMQLTHSLLKSNDKFKTDHVLKVLAEYAPLINSAYAVDRILSVAQNAVKVDAEYTAEDFSSYLKHVDGAMVWLGVGDDKHNSPLHSNTFDFNSDYLLEGTRLFLNLIDSFANT